MTIEMRRVRWWIGVLAIFTPLVCQAQILNTLRGFDEDATGWSGGFGAFFSGTGGNTENVAIGGAGSIQWQGNANRWRLLLDGTRAESNRSATEEALATHLRHNLRLSRRWASLAFVQHQYDRFQRVDSRFLAGAGVRWDFLRTEKLGASIGASPMLEMEKNEGRSSLSRGRLSTFVTILGRVDERVHVDVTAFVQPAMDELQDIRAVSTTALRLEISEALSLVADLRVQYDTEPAADVEKTDWKTRTGLSIRL